MEKKITTGLRKGKNGETFIDIEGEKTSPIYKKLEGKMVHNVQLRYLKFACVANKISKEELKEIAIKDIHKLCRASFYNLLEETIEFVEDELSYTIKGLAENRLSTVS